MQVLVFKIQMLTTDQDAHDTNIRGKGESSVTSSGANVVHTYNPVDDRNCIDKGTFSDIKGLDKDTIIAERETFARILQSIRNGQCEHVEKIEEEILQIPWFTVYVS